MKTISKFTLVLLLFTAAIACKNNTTPEADADAETDAEANVQTITETPELTAPEGAALLSFKMDGELVEGTFPSVMVIYIPAKKEVMIRGNTPQGLFSIIIDEVGGTGTYTIKGNSKSGAGIMMASKMYGVKKSGPPFTVTIDAVDDVKAIKTEDGKAIRGTFEGKFMDDEGNTINITDGKFSTQ